MVSNIHANRIAEDIFLLNSGTDGDYWDPSFLHEVDELTSKIRDIFERSLADTPSYAELEENYSHLNARLITIKDTMHYRKKWWQKILSFFFYLSDEEQHVCQLQARVSQKLEGIQVIRHKIWDGLDLSKQVVIENNLITIQTPEYQLKHAIWRVLGKNSLNCGKLEGGSPQLSHQQILKDLKSFRTMANLNKEELNKVKRAEMLLDELNQEAVERKAIYLNAKVQKLPINKINHDLAWNKRNKIQKLKPGMSHLMNGGSSNHAVIYEIQCVSSNQYKFIVYNTGDAAFYGKKEYEIINNQILGRCYTKVYDNLNLDQVSNHHLLFKLLNSSTPEPVRDQRNEKEMMQVYQYLSNQFAEEGNQNVHDGDMIEYQTTGNCTFACGLGFLRCALELPLYKKLREQMAEKAVADLKQFAEMDDKTLKQKMIYVTGTIKIRAEGNETANKETLSGSSLIKRIYAIGIETLKTISDGKLLDDEPNQEPIFIEKEGRLYFAKELHLLDEMEQLVDSLVAQYRDRTFQHDLSIEIQEPVITTGMSVIGFFFQHVYDNFRTQQLLWNRIQEAKNDLEKCKSEINENVDKRAFLLNVPSE